MTQAILVLNAGSSSVKYGVFRAAPKGRLLLKGVIERIGAGPEIREADRRETLPLPKDATHVQVLQWLANDLSERLGDVEVVAAGHRVVHGGQEFSTVHRHHRRGDRTASACFRPSPRHTSPTTSPGIIALSSVWPDIPQVACFDTAFHRTQDRGSRRCSPCPAP